MSPRFSNVTPGVRELLISLFVSEVTYLAHVECLYLIKPMVVGFCWRLMLLLVMSVGFENICTVSGKWNASRVVPRLCRWVFKILWLFSVIAEDSVVVVTSRYQSGESQFDSCEWLILDSCFIIFVFSSSWDMKFLLLFEDADSAKLLRLKSRSARGLSHHPTFMANCPINSHTC